MRERERERERAKREKRSKNIGPLSVFRGKKNKKNQTKERKRGKKERPCFGLSYIYSRTGPNFSS